jgi:putative transcriptional regulator
VVSARHDGRVTLRGKLLVATPPLVDPNFDRTVVLLLEHGDEGALGVVLNRPGDDPVGDVLRDWAPWVCAPDVLFSGGPVEQGAIIGLGRAPSAQAGEHWAPVLGTIGTVDLAADPDRLDPPVEALRIFRGYAGWGAGQLEGELEAGAWIVADFQLDDAFGEQPGDLWRDVLRRQGGRTAWLADYPDDPDVN